MSGCLFFVYIAIVIFVFIIVIRDLYIYTSLLLFSHIAIVLFHCDTGVKKRDLMDQRLVLSGMDLLSGWNPQQKQP